MHPEVLIMQNFIEADKAQDIALKDIVKLVVTLTQTQCDTPGGSLCRVKFENSTILCKHDLRNLNIKQLKLNNYLRRSFLLPFFMLFCLSFDSRADIRAKYPCLKPTVSPIYWRYIIVSCSNAPLAVHACQLLRKCRVGDRHCSIDRD